MSRIFSKTFNCDTTTRNLNKGKSFRFSEWDKTSLFVNDEYIQDFVSYAGSLYACIKSNSNITPSNEQYWKLVISGVEGPQGEVGETGAIFTPHVSESGVLSWTNDKDLENPVSVNIKGEKGDPSTVPGPKGDKGEKGDSIVGPKGDKGDQGIGLEFTWNGTKLGIRREGESRYTYVDLKGATGARGIRGPQGRQGDKGPQGPEGPKGDSLYIQVSDPNELGQRFLQKRYSEDEPWVPFFDLSEMRGENGKSIIVERDSSGNVYYRYEGESSSNNKLLIYKDEIKGPKGDTIARTYVGDDGYLYIQLSNEKTPRRAGYVRGDRGADGREIVLRTYTGPSEDPNDPRLGTHIQWKYAGDEYKLWTNLIQINELMNVALMGIKLEYNLEYDTDEDGVKTKYDVLEINSYQVEFDEEGKLVLTDKIANISRVAMPTHTQIISIEYDEEKNEIQFILDTATGQQVVAINCDRFIKAGDGITVDHGNIINVHIADDSEVLSDSSHILTVDKEGLRIRGVKDKLIKEVNLIKRDRTNDTHYYSYDYVAQDGTIYPIEIPDFVNWENNDDGSRQIFFRNNDKLVSWDSEKVVRDLIRLDETNTTQLGDAETSLNLNGKDLNPTYNQQEKLALLSNLEEAIIGLHLVKEDVPEESDLAARYSIADKDGNLLGNVHIDVLKDNYLKDVIYNEDTYTFTFDFWVNDDPEEASQVKVVTVTLQKLFDNLKALVDNLEAKHDSDIQIIRDEHKQDVKTLNETIATVNQNLVDSVNAINKNMADGFNTINGGINNEIRPAIEKNSEDISKLREDLTTEISNRENADNQLQSNIDAEVNRAFKAEEMLQTNINSEVNRALQAENLLQDNINTEVVRATNAEQAIQTSLNEEITRSKQVDQELIAKTDKLNQDLLDVNSNLAAEILRATNAESEIYKHIHELEENVVTSEELDKKEDAFTVGIGLEMTSDRVLNVILDTTVFKVVSTLPDQPLPEDMQKIHLVPSDVTGSQNIYKEYIWANNAWELLGEYQSEVDLTSYLTKSEAQETYQPIGDYALKSDLSNLATKDEIPDISNLASKSEIPTKVSELENDSNFLTSIPSEYVTESELDSKGYLTTIPDNYVTDTELQEAISGVQFELPIASDTVLGGIKVGAGLHINPDTGILSATGGGTADAVDWANVTSKPQINGHDLVSGNNTLDSLGIQPAGDYALKSEIPSLNGYVTESWVSSQGYLTSVPDNYITDNELTEAINDAKYTLPIASTDTLGGIKIGAGLSITEDGILSATGGGVADSVAWENVIGRPTNLSQFTNDSGFITSDDLPDLSDLATKTELANKQDILVSGTNIKTINGTSLLGSGNIIIESSGGESEIMDVLDNKTYARTQGSWVDLTNWLTWAEYD